MDRRVFLGWDEPLLGRAVAWLWERRDELPRMTVVVPTAQSGRRLREALAEKGACLAPKVVTPGRLLMPGGTAERGVRSPYEHGSKGSLSRFVSFLHYPPVSQSTTLQ